MPAGIDPYRKHGFGALLLPLLLVSCAASERVTLPEIHDHRAGNAPAEVRSLAGEGGLRVMTLNMAHGRGEAFHQLLQTTDTTRANLADIAMVLEREAPDIVSLQEADVRSFWNGNFDQVAFLARKGSFRQSVRGPHVDGLGLSYGTALVARLELGHAEAVTFRPGPLPIPKGFVVSTIRWPGRECIEVDVVSAHLDFASETTRRRQAAELIDTLRERNRPVVVMGDFNTGWRETDSAVRMIARELGLHTWQPEDDTLVTFPALDERLDWVLVSPEIRFRSHRVVGDVVSDHLGVVSELVIDRGCPPAATL